MPSHRVTVGNGRLSHCSQPLKPMKDDVLHQFQEISALLNSSLDHATIRRRAIEAATLLMDAEAGSLLLLDENASELYFEVAHGAKGDAVRRVRLSRGQGIAWHVARTGTPIIVNDVQRDANFFRHVDQASGFVTRNMVCVPVTAHGHLLGVLQAINRKNGELFSSEDLQNFIALGHQVGIAIENASLYEEIHRLFEGFISASVQAIESRDPTTSGHSQRVAILTCQLAEAVGRTKTGPYAGVQFDADQIKELRYAAVLHDFGKVGVREHILLKARKLYPLQQELIKSRFDFIKKTMEADTLRRKVLVHETKRRVKKNTLLAQLDRQLAERIMEVDEMYAFITTCNQSTSLAPAHTEKLKTFAKRQYQSYDGPHPFLLKDEIAALTVSHGTLTPPERYAIESHVTHTFEFLSKIPWTRSLRHIPAIAWSHHEKLDGSGYPRRLSHDQIPLQARMMTICDIYDALTASDRPYKAAVAPDIALSYLAKQTSEGKLDPDLVEVFTSQKIYLATQPKLTTRKAV